MQHDNVYQFLKKCDIGVLATVDPDGNPRASTMYYTVDSKFNTYFLTKVGTQKVSNIRRHNHVMFVVYEAHTQTTVQISGKMIEVDDATKIEEVFDDILKISTKTSEANIPPIEKLRAGPYEVLKLVPDQVSMAVFARPDQGDYGQLFEIIQSHEI